MADQELNKKLAEWAGFQLSQGATSNHPYTIAPDGTVLGIAHPAPLNFTSSLDACFKWLVPKLWDSGVISLRIAQDKEGKYWAFILPVCEVEGETPALALCKAIEQLIDGESKDG
jgi:hypothetical protein